MVKPTFYMVNFLFFILVSVKRRLQTSDFGGKVQIEDCRSGVKCRLGSKKINRGIDLIVKRKSEMLNVVKFLIQSTIPRSRLPPQRKTTVRETGIYGPSNRNCSIMCDEIQREY